MGGLGTSSVTFTTPAQQQVQQLMAAGQQIPPSLWGMGQDWSVYNAAHAQPAASPATSPVGGYGSSPAGPGTVDNSGALKYGQQIMTTAMDPQNALYDRSKQQMTDQVRASLAARGLDMSGAGAGIENQALSNFNIDWQNNLLNRQVAGAGAYTGLTGLAQNIANQGFQNADLLGREQYRAPAAAPSILGGAPMPSSFNQPSQFDFNSFMGPSLFDSASNQGPTGWSAASGNYFAPGTAGYNPNFQWS